MLMEEVSLKATEGVLCLAAEHPPSPAEFILGPAFARTRGPGTSP